MVEIVDVNTSGMREFDENEEFEKDRIEYLEESLEYSQSPMKI